MRDAQNIKEVEALGIDLMGFICWPERKSRYVDVTPDYLPLCKRVGVFVNPTLDFVKLKVEQLGLTHIQLHGQETPNLCREVKIATGCEIIKAISISDESDISQTTRYIEVVDMFLFDTKSKHVGGSGQKFDWNILNAYNGEVCFLLAGGLGEDDAQSVRLFHHPRCIGIDLNSKFEIEPALKDVTRLRTFINKVKTEG